MSASLYWRPHVPEPEGETLGYDLKFLLAKRYGESPSLNSEWWTMGERDIEWLREARLAAGPDLAGDITELIGLLETRGTIEVRIAN